MTPNTYQLHCAPNCFLLQRSVPELYVHMANDRVQNPACVFPCTIGNQNASAPHHRQRPGKTELQASSVKALRMAVVNMCDRYACIAPRQIQVGMAGLKLGCGNSGQPGLVKVYASLHLIDGAHKPVALDEEALTLFHLLPLESHLEKNAVVVG